LVSWVTQGREWWQQASRRRVAEACLLGASILAVGVSVFGWRGANSVPALVFLPLPLLLWAAVRFGPGGVSTALVAVAGLSLWGAMRGHGPFINSEAGSTGSRTWLTPRAPRNTLTVQLGNS
jgi:integral membrane sensor domain MASE1